MYLDFILKIMYFKRTLIKIFSICLVGLDKLAFTEFPR